MRRRIGSAAVVALGILAGGSIVRGGPALPPVEFAGSRPARPSEPPAIPLPDRAPLPGGKADSLILALSGGKHYPETRYDLFEVDLDGDERPETIAQISRITNLGFYSRCWWGIYSKGRLDQVLYWNRPDERTRISRIRPPESLRDQADSLSFLHSIPEFFPAVDVTRYADLTGDGRSEIAVWMAGRALNVGIVQGALTCLILSPGPDGIHEVFRAPLLMIRNTKAPPGAATKTICVTSAFRLRARDRRAGGAKDLVLEPWRPDMPPDTLCRTLGFDERDLPHDPDLWFPLKPLAGGASVSPDWLVSQWDGTRFGGYRFVRDAKLE